ncbi:protein MAINTENANCE OF MERISTEMS-like [Rhododendron vialii]|uniref:protein MAINTENANCE OF MERISTEMS-like n=1 Tax=Rhododendron vialii TaxID=182163 RepID=UPI00265DB616|nr:protein MAINTENANCE OF MERISTEMS-like [Rhododendron vialii]
MAVSEAESLTRVPFTAEGYMPPTPHLFVPSGFAAYKPRRMEYDPELVLRDPETHISSSWTKERARQRDIRGFGGACSSLALYQGLPARVRQLVDEAGFREFIQTHTLPRNDHAVLVALAERWRDTTNSFHLLPGEMTVTPADFTAITGLRVGGEPIPFDLGIHEDPVALEWFFGEAPKIEEGMARYGQFTKYLKKKVTTEQEAEQMARAYLLYLFGATLYPNRRSKVHLSYLSALRDLRTASRFDWGGAALGAAYGFLGDSSRTEMSTAGYWRIWELWAYEVLNMCRPASKSLDLGILPRAHIWSKKNMGEKKGRGDLNSFRIYLDELKPHRLSGILRGW